MSNILNEWRKYVTEQEEEKSLASRLGYDPTLDAGGTKETVKAKAAQLLKNYSSDDFCAVVGCPDSLGMSRSNMPQVPDEDEFERDLESPAGKGLETNEPDKIPDIGKATRAYLDSSDDDGEYPQGDQVPVEEKAGIDPDDLKPTQEDIYLHNATKKLISAEDPNSDWKPWNGSVMVSSDDYVLDGHHRWAAVRLYNLRRSKGIPLADGSKGKPEKMTIMKIGMPIQQLLKVANAYTDAVGGQRAKGGETVTENTENNQK